MASQNPGDNKYEVEKTFLEYAKIHFESENDKHKESERKWKKNFFLIFAYFSYHKQCYEAFRSPYGEKIQRLTNET